MIFGAASPTRAADDIAVARAKTGVRQARARILKREDLPKAQHIGFEVDVPLAL